MGVTLTYTNPMGKTVTFYTQRVDGGHPPYVLNYITGTGGPPVEYESSARTGNNGSYFGSSRFSSRKIQTGCLIYGRTDSERDRNLRALIDVLNPLLGDGILDYTDHYGKYRITARCAIMPSFGANTKLQYWKPVLIDFECAHPFFQGLADHSTLVAASSASFQLPFSLPFVLGSQVYAASANNQSAIPAPVELIIWGPAINPVVTNKTTGDSVRVRKEINPNERLVIVTGPIIRVSIIDARGNKTDALSYVSLLSTQWIQLMPGHNQLTYSSDDDSKTTRIEVHWSDWYQGVG